MYRIIYILLVWLLTINGVTAKSDNLQASICKNISVTDVNITKNGNKLLVDFIIEPDKKAVKSNYKMTLTPYLQVESDTIRLTSCVIFGRTKAKREKQKKLLSGIKNGNEYIIYQGVKNRYSCEIPYDKRMRNLSVGIIQSLEGCCSSRLMANEVLFKNLQTSPTYLPRVEYIVNPIVAKNKKTRQFDGEELIIDFDVSKIEINQELFSNEQKLKEIENAVVTIQKNPLTKLDKIKIVGYASPEGIPEQNIELAKNRAEALQYYLQERISGLSDTLFVLNNGVENWAGLRKMVAASKMEYRDQVLNFIDSTPLTDTKSRMSKNDKLKLLENGNPYRYILKNFYPHLRNASYLEVIYDQLDDTNADIINQAVKYIELKNYSDALNILLPISNDLRTWNALGVCYMMEGDEITAKKWFEEAVSTGDKNAKINLDQLK